MADKEGESKFGSVSMNVCAARRVGADARIDAMVTPRSMTRLREAVLRRELAIMLQERDALIKEAASEKQAADARLQAALVDHSDQVDILCRELAERDRLIAAIYASRSWRVGGAARRVSALLRRLLGRERGQAHSGELLPPALAPAQAPLGKAAPEKAKLPRSRGSILVAADILPLFDRASGGLRLKNLLHMMGDAGWSIVFGSFDDLDHQPGVLASSEGRSRYEAVLRKGGVVDFLYGVDEIGRFLAESGRDLDWIFLSFPSVATELLPLVRSRCPTARVIYDMVDFHGSRMEREAALRDDAELVARAKRQRAIEISCARAADVTIAVTEAERVALMEIAPEVVVEVLPNVFELPQHTPSGPEGRDGLLFVGGFWHHPNGDAMHWFVDRIWPLIRQEAPSLTLRIAGANAGDEVMALGARPGVEVLGFVPDLVPLFEQHRVFVAPLRYGAEMKGKVGQSLIHGLPVVATSIGAEGMALEDGVHVLVADQEEEFAAQVLRLLRDDKLWARVAIQGRAHIERTLSVDVVRKRLETLLNG